MITFAKKAARQPEPDESEANRFERIRKAASKGSGNPTPTEPVAAPAKQPRTTD